MNFSLGNFLVGYSAWFIATKINKLLILGVTS